MAGVFQLINDLVKNDVNQDKAEREAQIKYVVEAEFRATKKVIEFIQTPVVNR